MRKRIRIIGTGGAIAAAVAAMLIIGLWSGQPTSRLVAAEVLAGAATATSNLKSVHMTFMIRTLPRDNFSLIGPKYDFCKVEVWKEFNETGMWRVEKPGRVAVMDGNSTIMLTKPNRGNKVRPSKGAFDTRFLTRLADVHKLTFSALQTAVSTGANIQLLHDKEDDGTNVVVLSIETKTEEGQDSYLRNKFLDYSDNKRVYRFDAKTKKLLDFKIFVQTEKEDVLVLETTQIEYDQEFDPDVFELKLPENMIWYTPPQPLPDNEKYEKMSPKETARAFFQACAVENWAEASKYWDRISDKRIKNYMGGLVIIELGDPFKAGRYPGWFVPYEIKLTSGRIRKHNLAVRNDNPAKRFVVDGGI